MVLVVLLLVVIPTVFCATKPLVTKDREKYVALKDWFTKNGGYVHPKVECMVGEERGRGLFATGPVKAGEVIARAPNNILVTVRNIYTRFPDWEQLKLNPLILTGLFLAVEKFHLHDDTWLNRLAMREVRHLKEYMNFMGECRNGLFFSDQERSLLERFAGGRFQTNFSASVVESDYERILVGSGFTANAFNVSVGELKWGVCRVSSRSWVGNFMAPILDLVNFETSDKSNCGIRGDVFVSAASGAKKAKETDSGTWKNVSVYLVAEKDIAAGEELTFTYQSNLPNYALAYNYGFVYPNLISDYVVLPVLANVSWAKSALALHALLQGSKLEAGTPPTIKLRWTGFDSASIAALRVLAQPDEHLDSYFFTRIHGKPQEWYPDVRNEERLMIVLLNSVGMLFKTIWPRFDIAKFMSPQLFEQSIVELVQHLQSYPPSITRDFLFEMFQLTNQLLRGILGSSAMLQNAK